MSGKRFLKMKNQWNHVSEYLTCETDVEAEVEFVMCVSMEQLCFYFTTKYRNTKDLQFLFEENRLTVGR